MSILSSIRKLAGRKGGKRGGKVHSRKEENLVPKREYSTTTLTGLYDSLDERHRNVLKAAHASIRALAVPFGNVRRAVVDEFGTEEIVPCDASHPDVILSNVNRFGQTRGLQAIFAERKIEALGLPEEVTPAAIKFGVEFINQGMDGVAPLPSDDLTDEEKQLQVLRQKAYAYTLREMEGLKR